MPMLRKMPLSGAVASGGGRPGRPLCHPGRCAVGTVAPADSGVLLFTSPGDGEGKTATVARLAGALAKRSSGKILAIDANLRKPGLAAQLGVQSATGLPEVLAGTARWNDTLRQTAVPRLGGAAQRVFSGRRCRARRAAPLEAALGRISASTTAWC